jgi:hypothetical protein
VLEVVENVPDGIALDICMLGGVKDVNERAAIDEHDVYPAQP